MKVKQPTRMKLVFSQGMWLWRLLTGNPPPLPFHLFIYLFIYFKIIYFNRKLITLQYCSGFCHTLTWILHGCTCVPHPEPPSHLPPHPIPLGHPSAAALRRPVSCIQPGRAICFTYGSIHVSMLFSQIISPSPCLTESCSLHQAVLLIVSSLLHPGAINKAPLVKTRILSIVACAMQ